MCVCVCVCVWGGGGVGVWAHSAPPPPPPPPRRPHSAPFQAVMRSWHDRQDNSTREFHRKCTLFNTTKKIATLAYTLGINVMINI